MGDEERTEEQAGGGGGGAGRVIVTAIVAGVMAFGGAAVGTMLFQPAAPKEVAADDNKPGTTITLQPFVLSVADEGQKLHPMKMAIAIELKPEATEEEFNAFVPRIRSAVLTFMRTLTYEDVVNSHMQEQISSDLLKQIHELGAKMAQRVLVQEFVTQ